MDDGLFAAVRSPEYRRDPYRFLAPLREGPQPAPSALGPWMVSRYEDAARVLHDPAVSNRPPAGAAAVHGAAELARSGVPLPVNALDPPAHGRVRALVTQALARASEPVAGRVQHHADRLLDAMERRDDGRADVVEDLAYPLPMAVTCDLFGLPLTDADRLRRWGAALAEAGDPDDLLDAGRREAAATAQGEFAAYFAEVVLHRRRAPGEDVVSALIAARTGRDRLSFAELVVNGMFLLVNGYHNTVNLIANGVLALLAHRDQWLALGRDPALAAAAVEECLRYDSPVHSIARTAADGTQLMLLIGAAHRDPRTFREPDRLDIAASRAARCLSFGGGAHYCPGAKLARLEARVALHSLALRFPRLALDGEPVRAPTFSLRGLTALPVALR